MLNFHRCILKSATVAPKVRSIAESATLAQIQTTFLDNMDIKTDSPTNDSHDDTIEPVRSNATDGSQTTPVSLLQPIDMEEAAPVRTKLRVIAILTALYVSHPYL